MSRTYDALKRAEAEKEGRSSLPGEGARAEGRRAPEVRRDREASPRVEYERIRVWLNNLATRGERLQTVMVVGCRSGMGATTTAALLASTLAETRKSRVLVVDGNFRTPGLNLVFHVRDERGLSEIVSNGGDFEAHIQPTNRQNLFVLTGGQLASSGPEVFEGDGIDKFLAKLKEQFDFVIVDAAPILEFPDAYALAPKVDSIILVVQAEKTAIDDARRARKELERAGGRILGVVLNRQRDYTPALIKKLLPTRT